MSEQPISVAERYASVQQQFTEVTGLTWSSPKTVSPGQQPSTSLATVKQQIELFRSLMALMQFKLDSEDLRLVSENFSYLLLSKDGLVKLIEATLDIDETSQQTSTLDQRCHQFGNVVAFTPKTCCPLAEFYELIGQQVHSLLITTESKLGSANVFQITCIRKICAAIVTSLLQRSRKLGRRFCLEPLSRPFVSATAHLTINEAIEAIHSLVACRFDANHFQPLFAHLYYVGVLLDRTIVHSKSSVADILLAVLNQASHPEYLLDDAIFSKSHLWQVYTNDADVIRLRKSSDSTLANCETGLDLLGVDSATQLTVGLIDQLADRIKIDTFLTLIGRLTNMHLYSIWQKLLLCAIIDCLQQRATELIPKFSTRSIQFVSTLLRNACTLNTSKFSLREMPEAADDNQGATKELAFEQDLNSIALDQKTFAIEFLNILLGEREKLSVEDIQMLRQCLDDLKSLSESDVDDSTKAKVKALVDGIAQLDQCGSATNRCASEDRLAEAMRDLNDPLMPTRVHALVSLKQLFYAKDQRALEQAEQIIERLKICLSDPDSYLYLAAINTFAALATVRTDVVLPVLTEAFLSESRTVEERVNVGEIIVQLSKRLGDMSPVYADQVINCLLFGLRSDDASIRVSCLSCLAQFSAVLRFSLQKYMVEIVDALKVLIQSDPSLDVKRAAVMYFHLVLNNVDRNTVTAIESQMSTMYNTVKQVYRCSLDDGLRLHAQLALEQIERISKEILFPADTLTKRIQLL